MFCRRTRLGAAESADFFKQAFWLRHSTRRSPHIAHRRFIFMLPALSAHSGMPNTFMITRGSSRCTLKAHCRRLAATFSQTCHGLDWESS